MLRRIRAGFAEHEALMVSAEKLRIEQEAAARGAGLVIVSSSREKHASPTGSELSDSAFEAAAAASHHETIFQRVHRAVTTWNTEELRDMFSDFTSDTEVNRYVLMGSACSTLVIWAQITKAKMIGRLYDSLTATNALSSIASSLTPPKVDLPAASADQSTIAVTPHNWYAHASLLVAVLLSSLAEWALGVGRDYSFGRAKAARVVVSRKRYLDAMIKQDLTFHSVNKSTELSQRLQSDPDALDDAAVYSLERLLRGITALLCALGMIMADWRTFALGLSLRLPFALQFVEKSITIVTSYERLQLFTLQKAQARAAESLSHVVSIQAHTAEEAEVEGYTRLLAEHARVARRGAVAVSLLRHTEQIVLALSEFITLAVRSFSLLLFTRHGICNTTHLSACNQLSSIFPCSLGRGASTAVP